MTEQQAIAAAGAPTGAGKATVICKREGAVRELLMLQPRCISGLTKSLD
jgi:hypothetical protein